MNRGIVIVAHDTEYIEYTKIAKFCAQQAAHYLQLPITLITDNPCSDPIFDQVITSKNDHYQYRSFGADGKKWKNFNRCNVYDLTPYDHTLMIDCDYIINSTQLNQLWNLDKSFLCHGTSTGISKHIGAITEKVGQYDLNLVWATVVMFKKDEFSKAIFDMWKMIQQNYVYYAALFKFNNQLFRNDYALSIALNTVTGHLGYEDCLIQYPLINVFQDVDIKKADNGYEFFYEKSVSSMYRPYKVQLDNIDLHMMNKEKLLELINE